MLVVVAYTPTRSRGMSTPSETMRTATIHGVVESAKRAMRSDAVGSSDVTTSAMVPRRSRSNRAMPRAWSWSMAITRPPASGCSARMRVSRSWAARSASGSHSPSSESAVRNRCAAWLAASASWNVAASVLPSGAVHSITPSMRGKYTGRTTEPSRSAAP